MPRIFYYLRTANNFETTIPFMNNFPKMRTITGPEKIQILNQGNKIGNVSNGKLLRIYFNNFSVLSWDLVLIIYVINY